MDYAKLRDSTVTPLLQSFGVAVTFTDYADSYDPNTLATTRTPTNYAAYAVIEDYSFSQKDGTLVRDGDRKLIITLPVEPMIGDTVTILSAPWAVVGVKAVMPAGVAVLYELQVRQ